MRSIVGATTTAILSVLLVRAALNAVDVFAGLRGARAWVFFTVPFQLLGHRENFMLETVVVLVAMLFVIWATHDSSLRAIVPLSVGLLAIDTLLTLMGDVVISIGVRTVRLPGQRPPLDPAWQLLAVDGLSVVLWNLVVIGVAALCAIAIARAFGWHRWRGHTDAASG